MTLLISLLTLLLLIYVVLQYRSGESKAVGAYFILILLEIVTVVSYYQKVEQPVRFLWIVAIIFGITLISLGLSVFTRYFEGLVWLEVSFFLQTGLFMLYRLKPELALKQGVVAIVGLALLPLIMMGVRQLTWLPKLGYVYYGLALFFLLLSNVTKGGAKNWAEFFGISFQPSEFVKIIFVLFLSSLLLQAYQFRHFLMVSVMSAVVILILVVQRDLGGAFIFFTIYVVITYIYSHKKTWLVLQFVAASAAGVTAYYLFSHVRVRLVGWLKPLQTIDHEGYQLSRSLFALSNGKWFGTGLGEGMPNSIPVVESDFLFSAIGEEYGSLFILLLIGHFLFFVVTLYRLSEQAESKFSYFVRTGLTTLMGVQGFLIIGGVTGLLPITGVTLPFISYGGSSLVTSLLMVGLIGTIQSQTEQKKEKYQQKKELKAELPFRYIGILRAFIIVIYSVAFVYLTSFLLIRSNQIAVNKYNPRLPSIEKTICRGKIVDCHQVILAETTKEGQEWRRDYPYADMFAHPLGYIGHGKSGLESYYNVELLNSHRTIWQEIEAIISPRINKGSTIQTTLDYNLQKIAYQALKGKKGAVVVLKADTGEILAMVSQPAYNPNTIASDYSTISQSDTANLVNRAVSGLYPPGSTFKTITALAYYRQFGPEFSYHCQGKALFGHRQIACYHHKKHGRLDLPKAYAASCNTAFGQMAQQLGQDKMAVVAEDLLFNQRLPFDYFHEKSQFLVDESSGPTLIAETAIGQGKLLVTPLHNALITSIIANGGQLMRPYLVDKIISPDNRVVKEFLPRQSDLILQAEEVSWLQQMMEKTVKEGTAKGLHNSQYTAAGKTGSAENPFGLPHAWFVGYAPAEKPEIVVSIVVENAGTSSANAVPIARQLMDVYFGENK